MKNPSKTAVPIMLALVALAALAVYAGSLSGPFLWDDHYLVTGNRYISSWSSLPKIFSGDVGQGAGQRYGFYRPLQTVTYLFDHSIWGMNVFGYHLTSVMLHILVCFALFWLGSIIFKDELSSFFAAILYAVHPIHTEAVSYISGRNDPLAALFIILSIIFFCRSVDRGGVKYLILMALSYGLALLSRETSFMLPILAALYCVAFRKNDGFKEFATLLTITALYGLLRVYAIGAGISIGPSSTTISERLPGAFAAISEYARIIIAPIGIHMGYGQRTFYFPDIRVLAGIVIFFFLAVTLARLSDKRNAMFFLLGWFLVSLLPVLNIYPPLNACMAAHWLYVPSIGIFLLTGYGLAMLYRKENTRILAIAAFSVAVLSCSVVTISENNIWADPVKFYEKTMKYSADSYKYKLYYQLGNEYMRMGKPGEAVSLYRNAISQGANFADAYNKLGNAYAATGEGHKAITAYRKAIWIDPSYEPAYRAIAVIYLQKSDILHAEKFSSIADKLKN